MSGFARDSDGCRRRVEIPRHAVGISHSDGAYSRGRITSRRTHLMHNYGATAAEAAKYGNTLNLWQSLMLLQRWAPLIGYGQRFVNELDPYKKTVIVSDAAEWLASQTQAQADDQLVRMVADLLRTKEGEALVRWILLQVEAVR
jgi:hypothetical protein